MNCPKCDADISDTFERDDPSCGITAGWYCDACDLGMMPWTEADDARVRELCKTVDVGALTECPKCGMGSGGKSEMMLSHFCTHKYCPFRDWKQAKEAADRAADPYFAALDAWKKDGGARPVRRPDGIPTRADMQWMTAAELAIREAMQEAMDRVADHVEGRWQND